MRGNVLVGCLLLVGAVGFREMVRPVLASGNFRKPQSSTDPSFPYQSPQFTKFVSDSYAVKGSGSPTDFYSWFNQGFKDVAGAEPNLFLVSEKKRISSLNGVERVKAQIALGGNIHRIVKKVIPKFSLQNGFEFYKAKDLGQRQCFLQSVLVSGLLQRAGVPAGVVMVYKNIQGQATNNGHAVSVERLSDGTDILVDCSDPTPNVEHQGLFLRCAPKDYIYVNPSYVGDTGIIKGYAQEGGGPVLKPHQLGLLDLAFISSMFDYYRGERTPGGFFETPTTQAGLTASAKFLQKSIQENPNNPLAVYMLGHVLQKLGEKDRAASQYLASRDLYSRYGWVPQGVQDALRS